ncbi:MAG: YfhL family 4Fe-4S dicluster ferredoxin [Gemmatimonadota bacterium]|nr:YfhL family 4Fe-4S dicluster ferredoxin [Gemmatimonadota bacterium]
MATRITEDCIHCGACEDECPNGAISMGEDSFVIDPALCTECVGVFGEQMCALACPPDVCVQDPARIETEDELFARAKKLHRDQADSLVLSASTSHFRNDG